MSAGEQKAWFALKDMDADDVCTRTGASYDPHTSCYVIQSLGMQFSVDPIKETITSNSEMASVLLGRFNYFFGHSILWYFLNAKDIGLTGRLIRPESLKGGHHFFRGSHELPLNTISEKYGADKTGFQKTALALGGEPLNGMGDAAYVLRPLPRIPMTVVFWLRDDEFEPRTDLLLDSSASYQAPLDIIWSAAMFTLLMFI